MNTLDYLLSAGRNIDGMVNKLVNDIFLLYRDTLIFEDITYIIPAVWGAAPDKELDKTQTDIHSMTQITEEKIITALNINNLTEPQKFALRYLINRTLISTISFMIQMAKNGLSGIGTSGEDLLRHMEPSGTA